MENKIKINTPHGMGLHSRKKSKMEVKKTYASFGGVLWEFHGNKQADMI